MNARESSRPVRVVGAWSGSFDARASRLGPARGANNSCRESSKEHTGPPKSLFALSQFLGYNNCFTTSSCN